MAGASLLTLLDDIATLLDDVSVLSKVAVKKTAGVLGDDLAVNAEQVTGIRAERELPVVWGVFKGSALNKLIMVPAALLLSALVPWVITPILMLGGAFLCFEGFEKVAHNFLHSKEDRKQVQAERVRALADGNVDMVEFEKTRIRGAIRTDAILSAEIIVIALGTVQDASLPVQFGVLSLIAAGVTIGVYGLVAGIVKLDDLGMYLLEKPESGRFAGIQHGLGRMILKLAPKFMRTLAIVGTAAMFLVGGGILVHAIPFLSHWLHVAEAAGASLSLAPGFFEVLAGVAFNGLVGVAVGAVLVLGFGLVSKVLPQKTEQPEH